MNAVSGDLAAMPWRTFQRTPGGGRRLADDHTVDWLLNMAPNDEQSAADFRQALFAYALTWGNGVAEVEWDGGGRPVGLHLIEPWRVRPDRVNGRLVYRVANYGRADDLFLPEDVLHVKGMGDGVWGYSVLEHAARSLGVGLLADRHAGRGFANDGRPGGVIERKKKMSPEARKRYRDDWERVHKGEPGATAILEEGDTYKPFAPTSPQDSELLASRKFSATEITQWFRVPPHVVGILDRATFSNITQQSMEYVQFALLPWAVRAEAQAALKLFGRKQRGNYYTRINFDALLRADPKTRAEQIEIEIRSGQLTPDEARALNERDPIPGGLGSHYYLPVNWQTMDRAVNPPAPAPKPAPASPAGSATPAGDATSPPAGEGEGEKPNALAPVFRDAAARVLRREAHRAADALKRLGADPVGLAGWRDAFLAEHRGYFARAFGPAAAALGVAEQTASTVLAVEAADQCADLTARLAAIPADPDGAALAAEWEGRADALAARVQTRLSIAARVYGA